MISGGRDWPLCNGRSFFWRPLLLNSLWCVPQWLDLLLCQGAFSAKAMIWQGILTFQNFRLPLRTF